MVFEVAFAGVSAGRKVCRHNDQGASQREALKKEGQDTTNAQNPDGS